MAWTHKFDLLFKLIAIAICVALLVLFGDYLDQIQNHYVHMATFIVVIITVFVLIYYPLLRSLGTYCYANFTLKMKINFAQAKKLNSAYSPFILSSRDWLPMTELAQDDVTMKYEKALAIYEMYDTEKRHERIKDKHGFKESSLVRKILKIVSVVLMCGAFITGILNLPPSSYISNFYCKLFDTNSYFPMLNIVLMILPIAIIFTLIDNKLK
jgi:hypothetical protein